MSISVLEDERFWIFSVRDNGIGVDLKFGEKIFKIFKRAVSDTDYPGLGVGLTFAKKIVELHQGAIWVESGGNGGANFCFSIPKAL